MVLKQYKNLLKSESGEVMLESLIVYTITLALLFFILAVFSVIFQRWNIQIIANETAAKVAQTYRITTSETMDGYVSADKLHENWNSLSLFRYFNTHNMDNSAHERAKDYSTDRLKRTTYTHDVKEPEISVDVEKDAFPRRHIDVTIKGEYTVPFGSTLSYFGFKSTTKYEVTAYAECLDMMEYLTFTDYEKALMEGNFLGKSIVKDALDCLNSLLKLISDIPKLFP